MIEAPSTDSSASKTKREFPWGWLVFGLSIPALIICGLLVLLLEPIHKADSGFRKAKRTISAEEMRSWAFAVIKKHPATNGCLETIPNEEIPKSIINLYATPPRHAWIAPKTSESEESVMFMWGGGFFHWGITIGATNYVSPTSPGYRSFKLAPGIYYQREAAWGLL